MLDKLFQISCRKEKALRTDVTDVIMPSSVGGQVNAGGGGGGGVSRATAHKVTHHHMI